MKYEVSLSDGFGEPNVIVVNTTRSFARAIEIAIDSHYDDEDEVVEITCRRVEDKNGT